jgi:hypothetical protein
MSIMEPLQKNYEKGFLFYLSHGITFLIFDLKELYNE